MTTFAAWNAAIYVAQVEDERLSTVGRDAVYAAATNVGTEAWGRRVLCSIETTRLVRVRR